MNPKIENSLANAEICVVFLIEKLSNEINLETAALFILTVFSENRREKEKILEVKCLFGHLIPFFLLI